MAKQVKEALSGLTHPSFVASNLDLREMIGIRKSMRGIGFTTILFLSTKTMPHRGRRLLDSSAKKGFRELYRVSSMCYELN